MRSWVLFFFVSVAAFAGSGVWQKAGADEGLRTAFERATYSLAVSGEGTYRGENPKHRLTLEFSERETRLSHPGGSVSLHLIGYGYGSRLRKPADAKLAGTGNRVEYRRGDLTEWYVNGSRGLEQGFTLAQRPGTDDAGGPLVVALSVGGELAPVQTADSVLFESSRSMVLRYAGLRAWDAGGRTLASRLEVRGREFRLVVDDQSAEYPLTIDPTWTEQQELTASDGAGDDRFGEAVSVSGDTAAIGAPFRNSRQGAAYVFVRSSGVWSQQQELTAPDGAANDLFGVSVSVSGNTAVIGAYGKNGSQGAAYVFARSGTVWSKQQELTASDGSASDLFGMSVSMSGNTAAIGAPGINNFQGAAYVFVGSSGVWSQQQKLTASDGAASDGFSYSLSVCRDTVVIGAYGKSEYHGAAYVFTRSNAEWSPQQELTASDGAGGDDFGSSVAVSGATALIGAYAKGGDWGAAYVFVSSSGVWSQQQKLTAPGGYANDSFGASVSLSGDTAVIGAYTENAYQGAAYVFARSNGEWSLQQALTATDGAAGDSFGVSVSASGDTALIGASLKNSRGAAYDFEGPTLGANALLVGSAAGTSSVLLASGGTWTATSNDSFLHISSGSASGAGNRVVVFTYDAFSGTGTRTGTLSIAGATVAVTQAGTNYLGPGPVITLGSPLTFGPYGLAVDGFGNLYVADSNGGAIWLWDASAQQLARLTSAGLSHPSGVAVDDPGNLYIADAGSGSIKEWSASTRQVTVLAIPGLCSVDGVAVDGSGNLYLADRFCGAIDKWSPSAQQLTSLVPSGLMSYPAGVAVDGSGSVYFSQDGLRSIMEWSASTQQVTTLVSSGLSGSLGVAVDGSGNVYIVDYRLAIKQWSASTEQVTTLVSSPSFQPAAAAVDRSGNIYFTEDPWIKEIPNAFVGPASFTEPASAGTDSLLPVLPSTTSLAGIFAPTSDQSWLTIGPISNGVIAFSFTANTSMSRGAHITVLGHQIAVTQNGSAAQTITFGALANQLLGAAPLTVSATASSGLAVSFDSQTKSVCTVSGSQVTLAALGTCTIEATRSGDSNYAAAPPVTRSFQVTSPCDVNQDGTTVADAQTIIREALGTLTARNDLNGDGMVGVVEVQIVINAVLSFGCTPK